MILSFKNNLSSTYLKKLLSRTFFFRDQKFHEEVIGILESVQNQPHECGGEVKLVNGIFVEKSLEVNSSYLSQLITIYKTEVMKTDFQNCSEAKDHINQ